MKPRIAFADLQWMAAFEKIKAMGRGAIVGDWKILMLGGDPHPAWVQIGNLTGKRMVRLGDPFIYELSKANAKGHYNLIS